MILTTVGFTLFYIFCIGMSLVLTKLFIYVALKFDFLDYPSEARKKQFFPIPYLGGVSVFFSFISIFIVLFEFILKNIFSYHDLIFITLPALIFLVIGLLDDRYGISSMQRLFFQIIVTAGILIYIVKPDNIISITNMPFLNEIISILFIIGIINGTNFIDNTDGLASGIAITSFLSISLIAFTNNQSLIGYISLIASGSTLGFIYWNWFPSKIYLGDNGSYFLGSLIGFLAILISPVKLSPVFATAIPLLILAVPIIDMGVTIMSRIIRNVSIFTPGRDHLSHKIQIAGFHAKYSSLILILLNLTFNLLALGLYYLPLKWSPLILSISIVLGVFVFIVGLKLPINDK